MNAPARSAIAARSSCVGGGVVSLDCASAENGPDNAAAPADRYRNWRRGSIMRKGLRLKSREMTWRRVLRCFSLGRNNSLASAGKAKAPTGDKLRTVPAKAFEK